MYNGNRGNRSGGYQSSYQNRGTFDSSSMAPVRVGEELDVKIEAVGEKGDGIAKRNGFVLFVPNTNEGDEVKIRVTKVLRKVGFAEVIGAGSVKAESTQGTEEAPEEETAQAEESESFGEESSEESEEPAAEKESKEEASPEKEDESEDFGEE